VIPIYAAWLIQIEITNYCRFKCAYCTRATRHFPKHYFASVDFLERALQSLKGWEKGVGCMGGEPTEHPQFTEICKLYGKHFSKEQCGLFTGGGPLFEKYSDIINKTFGIIVYNDRNKNESNHRPPMIASEDVIEDEQLRRRLIDNCWLQRRWSPSITYKGCFFCEVAGTFDILFEGKGGYSIEPGWWDKTPEQFEDQVGEYCRYCSIALPIQSLSHKAEVESVSKSNAKRLEDAKSPFASNGRISIVEAKYTSEDVEVMERDITHPPYHPSNSHKRFANNSSSFFVVHPKAREWLRIQKEWEQDSSVAHEHL
jgi:hypothetical protein